MCLILNFDTGDYYHLTEVFVRRTDAPDVLPLLEVLLEPCELGEQYSWIP